MLITQGNARNERINLNLACSLAGVAGALNAAAFYSVGFFSANMTGNVSSFSDHVATTEWRPAIFYMVIVLVFVLGATLASVMIDAGRRHGIPGIYAYSILLEALLLFPLAGADIFLPAGTVRATALVLGLALLMGLQNATVTRISDARVRTTHVSGMATDIGIELGIAFDILRGKGEIAHAPENLTKLRLHGSTIGAFLLGGVIGVLVYRAIGGFLLVTCSLILLAVALRGLARAHGGR